MIIKNEFCQVEISCDEQYMIDSSNNRRYDLIFNPKKYTKNDMYNASCIEVKGKNTYRLALIGNYYSYPENCAILEDKKLIMLKNYDIYIIDLESMNLIEEYQVEDMACNFGIYRIDDGYIIHGEMEIKKLDFNFNKVWGFYGRDIFVSVNNKKAFEISNNKIKLYDFEDNYYELDFDGNEI